MQQLLLDFHLDSNPVLSADLRDQFAALHPVERALQKHTDLQNQQQIPDHLHPANHQHFAVHSAAERPELKPNPILRVAARQLFASET